MTLSPGSAVTLEAAQPGTAPAVTLQLPSTLAMQLPDPLTIHVPPGGIVNGEVFTLSDGVSTVTFEFENIFFGNGVAAGNRPVPFAPTDTAEAIGRSLVTEIAASGLFVEPTMLGGTGNIDLGGGARFTLQVPTAAPNSLSLLGPLSLQVPLGGGGQVVDGDYFTITQGANTFVFEFENMVAVPGGDGASRVGSILIGYDPADTRDQLANKIVARLGSVPGLTLTAVNAGNGIINLTAPAGTTVTLPPVPNHLFQTGPLSLQAPTQGGVEVADGDYFTILDGTTRFLFEFENMTGGNGASLVGSLLINFSPADTQDQLAERIIARLQAVAGLNLLPEKTTGDVRVHLGAVAYDTNPFTFLTLDTSRTHLSQTGSSDRLLDGQRIFLTNGTTVAALELDVNGSVRPGSAALDVSAGSTPHQIAGEIIFEINRAALGLTPRDLGAGLIHIGGTVTHDLDTASIPAITKLGTGGAIPDGQAFYVTEGAVTKRFEYDKNGSVTPGSLAISINDTQSLDDIAWATIARVSPGSSSLGISPSYLGNGLIDLGGNDENDVLTVSTSLKVDPSLPALQFRVPQRGAVASVIDGETFTITNRTTGTNYVFEYDNDGATVAGRIAVPFSATATRDDVAATVVARVRANVPGLTPQNLGDGVVDLNGNPAVFALTLALRVPLPGGGAGGVIDQETFTIRNLATGTNYVFEFDNNGVVLAGRVAIPFSAANTQNEVARSIVTVLSANVPGLTAVNLGDGIVNLGGNLAGLALSFEPGLPLVASGLRGAQTPHVQVIFSPSDDFTGNDVGTAIINAVNGTLNLDIRASVGRIRNGGPAARRADPHVGLPLGHPVHVHPGHGAAAGGPPEHRETARGPVADRRTRGGRSGTVGVRSLGPPAGRSVGQQSGALHDRHATARRLDERIQLAGPRAEQSLRGALPGRLYHRLCGTRRGGQQRRSQRQLGVCEQSEYSAWSEDRRRIPTGDPRRFRRVLRAPGHRQLRHQRPAGRRPDHGRPARPGHRGRADLHAQRRGPPRRVRVPGHHDPQQSARTGPGRHRVHAGRPGLRDRPARPQCDQRARRPGGLGRDGVHRGRYADRSRQSDVQHQRPGEPVRPGHAVRPRQRRPGSERFAGDRDAHEDRGHRFARVPGPRLHRRQRELPAPPGPGCGLVPGRSDRGRNAPHRRGRV